MQTKDVILLIISLLGTVLLVLWKTGNLQKLKLKRKQSAAAATQQSTSTKKPTDWLRIAWIGVLVTFIFVWLWVGKSIVDGFKESDQRDRDKAIVAAQNRRIFCAENPQAHRCFPLDTTFTQTATSSKQAHIVLPPGYSAEWVYDTSRVEWPKETKGQINKSVYFRVKPGVDTATIAFHLWRSS